LDPRRQVPPPTGNGSQQPIQAAFARDEFHAPGAVFENQLVMSFGDPQDFVDGLEPIPLRSYVFDAWPSGPLRKERRTGAGPSGAILSAAGDPIEQTRKLGSAFPAETMPGGLQ